MLRLVCFCFLIFMTAFSGSAFAQEAVKPDMVKQVPQSAAQIQMSFAPVVKKITPGVVNIYAKQMVQQQISPFFGDPFFEQFFGGLGGLQMRPRVANSLGSGVIVREDGLVVTNAHVAQNATAISVALSDRREFSAKLVLVDEPSDLALLQMDVKGQKLAALTFADSDKAEVGDLVLAIGNPFGVGQTVTSGIVSATARTNIGAKGFGYYLQTDAAINPGNSGGALVNMAGEVVGINTMIFSKTGGYMGIGFAVPSNLVKQVVASYEKGGTSVRRAWLGASLQPVTQDIADSVKMDRPRGMLVKDVYKGSPAFDAGIKRGDILLSLDGRDTDDIKGVRYILAIQEIGAIIPAVVLRNGEEKTLTFTVTVPSQAEKPITLKGGHPLDGADVVDVSPALLEEMDLGSSVEKGVMIVSISDTAARLGLRKGDILVAINGQQVENARQLAKIMEKRQQRWRLDLIRNGQRIVAVVQ